MDHMRIHTKIFVIVIVLVALPVFATGLWITAKFSLLEKHFEAKTSQMGEEVKTVLDSNDIILNGFSAFLKAVDSNDSESAQRYAAFLTTSYPQIYMLEVARKVSSDEAPSLQESMRKGWNKNFTIKSFSDVTHRSSKTQLTDNNIWPILFMYPDSPATREIYGTRLETVDYLAHSLKLSHENHTPVASPLFELYEGGKAYILLKEVSKSASVVSEKINYFGNTMMAILLIKTQDLLPKLISNHNYKNIHLTAFMNLPDGNDNKLFEYKPAGAKSADKLFLPVFKRHIEINNSSQPVVISFEYQLRWEELLTQDVIYMLVVILSGTVWLPWMIFRHYKAIEQAKIAYEKSDYLASHDLLTGLSNRFSFINKFTQITSHSEPDDSMLGLMLIDLDHFKEINDTYGHDAGDQVLVEAAKRMNSIIRSTDTACRYGGDEFIVLLRNITDENNIYIIGEKLRQSICEPMETSVGMICISCSIGTSLYPNHANTLDDLIKTADNAMFSAKKQGRNSVAIASESAKKSM